nr:mitochondrial uncoupling protein 5-like [Lolium perenne]
MGVKGFVEGGIASIVAGCSTHPLDLIKVRMQLQGEASAAAAAPQAALRPALAFRSGTHTVSLPALRQQSPGRSPSAREIPARRGRRSLFSGISATVLRRTLYSTTRMGLYDILKKRWTRENGGVSPLHRRDEASMGGARAGASPGGRRSPERRRAVAGRAVAGRGRSSSGWFN